MCPKLVRVCSPIGSLQMYPATLPSFGKGTANIMGVFWFSSLLLLGIDSLFAMVEGVSSTACMCGATCRVA